MRLGLCCKFHREPIKFQVTTAAYALRLAPRARLSRLAELCLANAAALERAIGYCSGAGIGCFRVNSQVLPLKTHPAAGYDISSLPGWRSIVAAFRNCGTLAARLKVRLTFHPDQFILLSSQKPGVTELAVKELEYQAETAGWLGADVINIHGGGAYGDKKAALARAGSVIKKLSRAVRSRLALENDDRTYTPADLLPFCREHGIPFVYDVHHHRCLPDGLSVEEVTRRALATWDREPLFHVSSPRDGWNSSDPRPHHDHIDPKDFPDCWRGLDITVEVEAKAKELAIARLRRALAKSPAPRARGPYRP